MAVQRLLAVLTAFALQTLVVVADRPFAKSYDGFNNGSMGTYPNQTFRSTDIVGPLLRVSTLDLDKVYDARYIFMNANYGNLGGPMILDSRDLSLVYFNRSWGNSPGFGTRVQKKNGTNYLTFHAGGAGHVMDSNYNEVYTIRPIGLGNVTADVHEFQFTDQGTVVMTVMKDIFADLSSIGGPKKALLMDCWFQEIDLDTNELLFQWKVSDHFNMTDSQFSEYNKLNTWSDYRGFDAFHMNSVVKTDDGNYLISLRYFSAVVLINGKTGKPIWQLGGKNNDFKGYGKGKNATFYNQHDPRFMPDSTNQLSLYDNHGLDTGSCNGTQCSRAIQLELDYDAMTVKLLARHFNPDKVRNGAMGSAQPLSEGNWLVAWGLNPGVSEFAEDGTCVMNFQHAPYPLVEGVVPVIDTAVYRAYKMDWDGVPLTGPDVAVDVDGKGAKVYVSWNGATGVDSWVVYASSDEKSVSNADKMVGNSSRQGFETMISLSSDDDLPRYARVMAMSENGKVMGSTAMVDLESGKISGTASVGSEDEGDEGDDSGDDDGGDGDKGDGGGDDDGGSSASSVASSTCLAAVLALGVAIFLGV